MPFLALPVPTEKWLSKLAFFSLVLSLPRQHLVIVVGVPTNNCGKANKQGREIERKKRGESWLPIFGRKTENNLKYG